MQRLGKTLIFRSQRRRSTSSNHILETHARSFFVGAPEAIPPSPAEFLLDALKNKEKEATINIIRSKSYTYSPIADSNGNSAIHYAANHGWVDVLEMLHQKGAPLEQPVAAQKPSYITQRLSHYFPTIFTEEDVLKLSEGDTALHIAIRQEHTECIAFLARYIDSGLKNAQGETPLSLATDRLQYCQSLKETLQNNLPGLKALTRPLNKP